MGNYTITAVSDQVRDWNSTQGGPMKGYRITLRNADGREMPNVEWSRKATSPGPTVGQTVEGTVDTSGQYGPKFKAAMGAGGPGGGGFNRGKPVEERRSIAMQHAQKCAVSILQTSGDPAMTVDGRVNVESVTQIAWVLFRQVLAAETKDRPNV